MRASSKGGDTVTVRGGIKTERARKAESGNLLDTVHDTIYALLTKYGVDDLVAIKATQELCEQIKRKLGGERHYLPALNKDERYRQILTDLNAGLDLQAVAARNEVCERTVRRAIRMRAGNPQDVLKRGS